MDGPDFPDSYRCFPSRYDLELLLSETYVNLKYRLYRFVLDAINCMKFRSERGEEKKKKNNGKMGKMKNSIYYETRASFLIAKIGVNRARFEESWRGGK